MDWMPELCRTGGASILSLRVDGLEIESDPAPAQHHAQWVLSRDPIDIPCGQSESVTNPASLLLGGKLDNKL
jgi:hypothetical protein